MGNICELSHDNNQDKVDNGEGILNDGDSGSNDDFDENAIQTPPSPPPIENLDLGPSLHTQTWESLEEEGIFESSSPSFDPEEYLSEEEEEEEEGEWREEEGDGYFSSQNNSEEEEEEEVKVQEEEKEEVIKTKPPPPAPLLKVELEITPGSLTEEERFLLMEKHGDAKEELKNFLFSRKDKQTFFSFNEEKLSKFLKIKKFKDELPGLVEGIRNHHSRYTEGETPEKLPERLDRYLELILERLLKYYFPYNHRHSDGEIIRTLLGTELLKNFNHSGCSSPVEYFTIYHSGIYEPVVVVTVGLRNPGRYTDEGLTKEGLFKILYPDGNEFLGFFKNNLREGMGIEIVRRIKLSRGTPEIEDMMNFVRLCLEGEKFAELKSLEVVYAYCGGYELGDQSGAFTLFTKPFSATGKAHRSLDKLSDETSVYSGLNITYTTSKVLRFEGNQIERTEGEYFYEEGYRLLGAYYPNMFIGQIFKGEKLINVEHEDECGDYVLEEIDGRVNEYTFEFFKKSEKFILPHWKIQSLPFLERTSYEVRIGGIDREKGFDDYEIMFYCEEEDYEVSDRDYQVFMNIPNLRHTFYIDPTLMFYLSRQQLQQTNERFLRIVETILSRCDEKQIQFFSVQAGETVKESRSILHTPFYFGYYEMVKILLRGGVNPNLTQGYVDGGSCVERGILSLVVERDMRELFDIMMIELKNINLNLSYHSSHWDRQLDRSIGGSIRPIQIAYRKMNYYMVMGLYDRGANLLHIENEKIPKRHRSQWGDPRGTEYNRSRIRDSWKNKPFLEQFDDDYVSSSDEEDQEKEREGEKVRRKKERKDKERERAKKWHTLEKPKILKIYNFLKENDYNPIWTVETHMMFPKFIREYVFCLLHLEHIPSEIIGMIVSFLPLTL